MTTLPVTEYNAYLDSLPSPVDPDYDDRRQEEFLESLRGNGMASVKKKIARSRAARRRMKAGNRARLD